MYRNPFEIHGAKEINDAIRTQDRDKQVYFCSLVGWQWTDIMMDDMQQGKQYDHLFEYILDTVVNKNTVLIFV